MSAERSEPRRDLTPGTENGQPTEGHGRARVTRTGTYLLRGVPRDLHQGARGRAEQEGTALRRVLLQALREYAAGTWTPRVDGEPGTARAQ